MNEYGTSTKSEKSISDRLLVCVVYFVEVNRQEEKKIKLRLLLLFVDNKNALRLFIFSSLDLITLNLKKNYRFVPYE